MHNNLFLLFLLLFAAPNIVLAQTDKTEELRKGEFFGTKIINGTIVKILIVDGDTLPVVDLDAVQITNKRNFKDRKERKRYHQWRKYSVKVYPYAAEAIKIFRKIEENTKDMRKIQKRKYAKKIEKELKPEYEDKLKKLTKSQGYILIKMVERELGCPFYDVIVQLRGKGAAIKWQTLGRLYGYNLRKGYKASDDELLETILQDLNISYKD